MTTDRHPPLAGGDPLGGPSRLALVLWLTGVQVHEALGTAGLVALVVVAAARLARAGNGARLAVLRGAWPVLAFVGWAVLAPAVAGRPPSGVGVARMADWLAVPLVALTAAATGPGPGPWRGAAAVMVMSSVVAGLQHVGAWPPSAAFHGLQWTQVPFDRVYEAVPGAPGRFMGGGLLFHRLKFGHVTGLMVVGTLGAAFHARGRERALLLAAAIVGFLAVWLFPYARMAAVAMTAGVVVMVALVLPSRRSALAVAAAVGVAAALVVVTVPSIRDRFLSSLTDRGAGQRSYHLSAGLEAVAEHPLAGVGPGQFRPSRFATVDMPQHVKDNPGKAHNQLVSMAAETGLPGAALFLVMLVWLSAHIRTGSGAATGLGAMASFLVLGLAHDPLFQAPYSLSLVVVLGLALAPARLTHSWLSPRPATP